MKPEHKSALLLSLIGVPFVIIGGFLVAANILFLSHWYSPARYSLYLIIAYPAAFFLLFAKTPVKLWLACAVALLSGGLISDYLIYLDATDMAKGRATYRGDFIENAWIVIWGFWQVITLAAIWRHVRTWHAT